MFLRHKGKLVLDDSLQKRRWRGGKADLLLRHRGKLVLVRFNAEAKIGSRASTGGRISAKTPNF